jgi:hypothetical protein
MGWEFATRSLIHAESGRPNPSIMREVATFKHADVSYAALVYIG